MNRGSPAFFAFVACEQNKQKSLKKQNNDEKITANKSQSTKNSRKGEYNVSEKIESKYHRDFSGNKSKKYNYTDEKGTFAHISRGWRLCEWDG